MVRFRRCLGVLAATACTLGSTVAFAEPFHEDPPHDAVTAESSPERWYGWQTLSVDALPAGLFAFALLTEGDTSTTLWAGGGLAFALGAPTVHVLHERPLVGLGSFGLRVGLPFVGALIGSAFVDLNPEPDLPGVEHEPDDGTPIILGGLVGAATATALDAAFLGYEPAPSRAAKSDGVAASNVAVSFRPARGGGQLAVLGAF